MQHNTYERFQGIWWGSIIGVEATSKNLQGQYNWLLKRQQIAEVIFQAKYLATDDTALQGAIQQVIKVNHEINDSNQKIENLVDRDEFVISKSSLEVTSNNHKLPNKLLEFHSHLLSLLPLIIFTSDNQQLFSQIVSQDNLKSANSAENNETKKDILIWGCLLTFILNNEFQPRQTNFALATKQILNNVGREETPLTKKLNLAVQAANSGLSLHQLANKTSSGNIRQTAIALAWYLFITTPGDFKLSIQRTANLKPNLAWLTAALTGTLSGAYNGLTGIPWSWRSTICQNPNFSQENYTIEQLFKVWLGMYSINSDRNHDHQQLYAVANSKIIQPRKALKIISQKSML